jgi:hypothetical protein
MAALTPLDGGAIKQSRASLIGGIAVAVGVGLLGVAILRDHGWDSWAMLALNVLVSGLIGLWIWKADL